MGLAFNFKRIYTEFFTNDAQIIETALLQGLINIILVKRTSTTKNSVHENKVVIHHGNK
jgi:hypothetical protein